MPGGKRTIFWTVGGLALGLGAALLVGMLVFWVHPALRKAQSPMGEVRVPPIVLRYPKESVPEAAARETAEKMRSIWFQTLDRLGLQLASFPPQIHIYAYNHPQEVILGVNERLEREGTPVALVDLLWAKPPGGALGRLACAVALSRPGNALFPRGLARILETPDYAWEEEAGAWLDWTKGEDFWTVVQRLLPPDPWETWYFTANAPWVGMAPTLETLRALVDTLGERGSSSTSGRVAEVLAAGLARWVLERFGPQGVRAFWTASSWEAAAAVLAQPPANLAQDFASYLSEAFTQSPRRPYLQALRDLQEGRAEAALPALTGVARASALLALGRVQEAVEVLGPEAPAMLKEFAQAPRLEMGGMILIGGNGQARESLGAAQSALDRVRTIWRLSDEDLPDRIVFYVGSEPPGLLPSWGILWIATAQDAPKAAVRLGLEAVSPRGLPSFSTLVEGLVLCFAQSSRNFRAEAQTFLRSGKWVSLTQPLFGVYPQELAEAEAGALVTFILERFGEEGLKKFWEKLEGGASPFRACEEALGLPLPVLDRELQAWVTQP